MPVDDPILWVRDENRVVAGILDDQCETFRRRLKGLHLVEPIDHRTEDRGVGSEELCVFLAEIPWLEVVDLEQTESTVAR